MCCQLFALVSHGIRPFSAMCVSDGDVEITSPLKQKNCRLNHFSQEATKPSIQLIKSMYQGIRPKVSDYYSDLMLRKPVSQSQCNFHLEAVLLLFKGRVTVSDCDSNTSHSHWSVIMWESYYTHLKPDPWVKAVPEFGNCSQMQFSIKLFMPFNRILKLLWISKRLCIWDIGYEHRDYRASIY